MTNIILEAFSKYLQLAGVSYSTRKNYISDLRHFFTWLFHQPQNPQMSFKSASDIVQYISVGILGDYMKSLSLANIPPSHANRKLSSLRKFFDFAIDQQWIKTNPARNVSHFSLPISENYLVHKQKTETGKILSDFKKTLIEEKVAESTIKNYVSDVEQFLEWYFQL